MGYGAGLPGFGAGRGTGYGAGAGGRYGAGMYGAFHHKVDLAVLAVRKAGA